MRASHFAALLIVSASFYEVTLNWVIQREPFIVVPTTGASAFSLLILYFPDAFTLHRTMGLHYLAMLLIVDAAEDWAREWAKSLLGVFLANVMRSVQPLLSVTIAAAMGEFAGDGQRRLKHVASAVAVMGSTMLVMCCEAREPTLRPPAMSGWLFVLGAACAVAFVLVTEAKVRLVFSPPKEKMDEVMFWSTLSALPLAEAQIRALGRPELALHPSSAPLPPPPSSLHSLPLRCSNKEPLRA